MAKQTVQRTIDQLRVEGLLITRPGSGTYVRGTRRRLSRLSRGRYGPRRGYHVDLAARYRQTLTEVGTCPRPPRWPTRSVSPMAPPCLCAATSCEPRRQPVEMGASWFLPRTSRVPHWRNSRLRAAAVPGGRGGDRAPVCDCHGPAQRPPPSRDEAALLFIRPDTPVLHLLHSGFDDNHRPIEVAQATWPGPMTTLVENYPVPGPLDDTDPEVAIG